MNQELLNRANINRAEVKRLIREHTELMPDSRRKILKIEKVATICGHSCVRGLGMYEIELTDDDLLMLAEARQKQIDALNDEFFAFECEKEDWRGQT